MKVTYLLLLVAAALLVQCTKKVCDCPPPPPGAQKLSYGDSVIYLKNTAYTIAPLGGLTGTFSAEPNNLQINTSTGAITVSQKGTDGESQTGLRYKIRYRSVDGQTDSTFIVLSGLAYVDQFYRLSQSDSIIYPIYNATLSAPLPAGNYALRQDNKLDINPANGRINIRSTIRRGFFNDRINTDWKIARIDYALNDKSNGVENSIEVVLYYYNTMAEVPSNVSALMRSHQGMMIGMQTPFIPVTTGAVDNNLPSNLSLSKPRPPCVIIVGN